MGKPIRQIQNAIGQTTVAATSFTVTLGSTPIQGNSLIAVIATGGTTTGRVTGLSHTNMSSWSWQKVKDVANTNGVTTSIWIAHNVFASAGTVITINLAASLKGAAVIAEYSGLAKDFTYLQDQSNTATGSSATVVTGTTPTTTAEGELYIGGVGTLNTGTYSSPQNGYNLVNNTITSSTGTQIRVGLLELINTTGLNATSTGVTNSSIRQYAGAIFTFKADPGYARQLPKPKTIVSAKTNSLRKGLVVDLPLNEGGGTKIRDYSINNLNPTMGAGTGWARSMLGTAVTFNTSSTGNIVLKSTKIVAGKVDLTIRAMVKVPNKILGTSGYAIYAERGTSGNDILKLEVRPDNDQGTTNGQLRLTYRDDAGTLNQISATNNTLLDGLPHDVTLRKKGTAISFFMDGRLIGTGTLTATNNFTDATLAAWVGGDPADTSAGFGDQIMVVNVWERALNDTEILTLQRDPWQMYRSRKRILAKAPPVVTPVSVTKSLKYTVIKAASITKSLNYTVKTTPSAITKSLSYKVKTLAAVTKSLTYQVKKNFSTTKSLKYTIKITPSAITKSLQYAIKVPVSITKSLTYQLVSLTVISITKSLSYSVRKSNSVTKSLKYTVFTPLSITKSLKYTVIKTFSLTKSLQYSVEKSIAITKNLKYTVHKSLSITKNLTYSIETVTTIQKSLRYAVKTTQSITKSLNYKVLKATAITKSLKYTIPTSPNVTKSLSYSIDPRYYTREAKTSLPTNSNSLAVTYSPQDYVDVEADDAVRVGIEAMAFGIHHYRFRNSFNNQDITIHWNGQSSLAPSNSTVYLQIYNFNSASWETIDSDNAASADTDFNLDAVISTNVENYYDAQNHVVVRIYQERT